MDMKITLTALAAVALAAAHGATPLLTLDFEGDCMAVRADGGKVAPTEPVRDITYGPGILGKAAHFGRGAGSLRYPFAGNVDAERGTVMFWYRPDAANDAWVRDRRPLFAFDEPKTNDVFNGTGWIHLLHETGRLQARFGTDKGGGEWRSVPLDPYSGWRHIAIAWDHRVDGGQIRLFVDGVEFANRGDGYVAFRSPYGKFLWSRLQEFKGFVVGGERVRGPSCMGWMDSFRVYGEALSREEIENAAFAHKPLSVSLARHFAWQSAEGGRISAIVTNMAAVAVSAETTFTSPDGKVFGRKGVRLPPHGSATVESPSIGFAPGRYRVSASAVGKVAVEADFWTMGAQSTHEAPDGKLTLKPVFAYDFGKMPSADRIATNSPLTISSLNGRRYIETAPRRGSRFAFRIDLPEPDSLYCFEWEWPDDKARFADVLVQPAMLRHYHYELQCGYATGGPLWPVSGKMHTVRQFYWASTTNCAAVVGTLKDGEPAGVASLKVYRVVGDALPAATRERNAVPAPAKGGRPFGLYFEDPSIGLCCNVPGMGREMPGMELLINRTVAYMKHIGQNYMGYPGTFYNGKIGSPHSARSHMTGFLEAWYARFDREGFSFMPIINLYNVPFSRYGEINAVSVTNGTFNGTCADITDSGGAADKWVHQAPTFNGLHSDVQAYIDRMVDDFVREGLPHKSFKGIDFYFHSAHNIPWLGTIHAGYNDWMVDGFTKDTGIRPPVDRSDPARGRKYAEWLKANAYEQWVDWRCRRFAEWVRRTARRLADARSDLKLCITVQSLVEYEKQDPFTPHLQQKLMREGALDVRLLADIPNLMIREGCRPVSPCAYQGKSSNDQNALQLMNQAYTAEYWEPLTQASEPHLNIHDHYWESNMGSSKPLEAPWLRETSWRVCTVNPLGRNAMKAYVEPFRYGDVLGITRGGFLIGTYGLEELLAPFAKAFTALPRTKFVDVPECSTADVKVRRHAEGGYVWTYAVNAGGEQTTVTLPATSSPAIDLATGRPAAEWRSGGMALTLQPYEFRAFAVRGR